MGNECRTHLDQQVLELGVLRVRYKRAVERIDDTATAEIVGNFFTVRLLRGVSKPRLVACNDLDVTNRRSVPAESQLAGTTARFRYCGSDSRRFS